MKQGIKTFMFAIALSMTCSMAMAQGSNQNNGNRPSHEQMVEQQANSIAKQLGLDAKTSKKFVSVYKSEQSDMRNLMPQRRGGMGMPPKGGMPPTGQRPTQGERPQGNPPAMNGNKPMGRPQMSDEDKKKVENLKQKYNKKYAKFLSQDQITKVYQLQEQERAKRRPQAKQK